MPNQPKLKSTLAKQSPVPSGRLTRFAKFGLLTTGIAGSMLVNGAKRLASGHRPKVTDLLLTPANAKRVVQQLAQMRGAAMKLGQLLSMDAGDIIPPELAKILSALRADADAMPSEQVQQVLIHHWGKTWAKRVKSFDFDSVAAASIGQVHRAIAKNGDAQYPGVRKSIDSDVDNVASLLRFSGLVPSDIDLKPFLKDAKKQLHNEANYLREGQFLQRFHDLLKDDEAFRVPQWFESLSTTDVLAMTFVESVPIEDMIHAPQAQRNAIVRNLLALFLREVLEFRMVQTDPNFANYRYCRATQQIVLLDFGAVHEYTQAFSSQFKKLIKSALSQDKEKMQAAAASLGYFSEATEARHKAMILAIFDVAFEAQCYDGEYDFSATDLAARLNPLAFELMKDRDFWEVPPTPVLLLQRKIAGLFLLAVKLNAKVNVNEIVRSAVATTSKGGSELPARAA
jgi:predicted unusual protein kinase regulating ubiquinone biosynthesis (AarF/ABC1/UbiB family)